MSGHKHTTISLSQDEYRKLHEAEMHLRFMNEKIPDLMNEKGQEINEKLRDEIDEMQFRQDALLESLEQVNLNLVELEHSSSQKLLDQQITLHHHFSDFINNYQDQTENTLANLENHYQSQLQEVLESHQNEWSWLASEWQRFASNDKQKQELAVDWLNAASIIDQFIDEHYNHNLFAPGELNRLEVKINRAQSNLEQHLFEASITVAQDSYFDLSELRIELEKKHTESEYLHKTIEMKAKKLDELFNQSAVVPAIDLDGTQLPYDLTVDYWCKGKLSSLEKEFNGVIQDFLVSSKYQSIDDLQKLAYEYLPSVEEQIYDFTFDARMKVINAQLRMNIAEIVVNALDGQGYALDSSYFITDDEREAYQANLINYEGSQVIVKVDPISDQDPANELHLYTSDPQTKTAHELKQRALEIRRALQSSGLKVGTILANRKTPDPALFSNEIHTEAESARNSMPDIVEKSLTRIHQPITSRRSYSPPSPKLS